MWVECWPNPQFSPRVNVWHWWDCVRVHSEGRKKSTWPLFPSSSQLKSVQNRFRQDLYSVNVWPGEEVGLRGVGGGGLEGLGGRRGLEAPDDTEGEPVPFADLRPLGEDLCSTPSTAGELSRLRLWGGSVDGEKWSRKNKTKKNKKETTNVTLVKLHLKLMNRYCTLWHDPHLVASLHLIYLKYKHTTWMKQKSVFTDNKTSQTKKEILYLMSV